MAKAINERYYWRPLSLHSLFSDFTLKSGRLLWPLLVWAALIIAGILIVSVLLPVDWLAVGTGQLQITKFFIIYPSFVLGILLLFWFGFEWSFIPVYISSFVLAFHSGMALSTSLLFGLSFVFGLAIFGLSYQSLNMPFDLRDFKSIAFFISVAFIAAVASSVGGFMWSLSHQLTALDTITIWKSWWTGIFFQTVLITGPLLFLLTPSVERLKTKYYRLEISNEISLRWIYGTVVSITVVLLLFIISAKWLGNWRVVEILNTFSFIPESQILGALTSFEIIFWISFGLILLTGYVAIYLIGNWNRQLRERVEVRTAQLQKSEKKLQKSLNEKKLLLQEIHHRIKNNMAHVSALLRLQQLTIDDEYYVQLIEESRMRVHAMALVHEALYRTEDFTNILLKEHIKKICEITHESFSRKKAAVKMRYDMIECSVNSEQAVPLGLIVNEAVINAHKYAFDGLEGGVISIKLAEKNKHLELSIADNGVGIQEKETDNNSLGMELIENFAQQLSGDLNIESGQRGTKITLIFTPLVKNLE